MPGVGKRRRGYAGLVGGERGLHALDRRTVEGSAPLSRRVVTHAIVRAVQHRVEPPRSPRHARTSQDTQRAGARCGDSTRRRVRACRPAPSEHDVDSPAPRSAARSRDEVWSIGQLRGHRPCFAFSGHAANATPYPQQPGPTMTECALPGRALLLRRFEFGTSTAAAALHRSGSAYPPRRLLRPRHRARQPGQQRVSGSTP